MKQLTTIAIIFIMVLAGCSATNETPKQNATVENSQTNNTEIEQTEIPVKEPVITQESTAISEEETLKNYMDTLLNKDYEGLKQFVYTDNANMTVDEFVKAVKENDFKNNTERTEYIISSITNYDDEHRLATVIVKGTTSAGEASATDQLGITLVNGEWKVDISLVVSKETISTTFENDYLKVDKIEKITKLNGYQLNISYTNTMSDNHIIVGFLNTTTAELTTSNGNITAALGSAEVEPLKEGSFSIFFETESPSIAQSIKISNLHIGDMNGVPMPGVEPFQIEIVLQ